MKRVIGLIAFCLTIFYVCINMSLRLLVYLCLFIILFQFASDVNKSDDEMQDLIMLYVNIIMLHFDMNKSHFSIIILHVDIIYLECNGQIQYFP